MATAKPKITGLLAELIDEVDVPPPLVVTSDITVSMPTRSQMTAYYNAETGEDRNRAIFGEHYDAVNELFGSHPAVLWNAFCDRVSEHFFGRGSTKVEGK